MTAEGLFGILERNPSLRSRRPCERVEELGSEATRCDAKLMIR
jgi:hypothetical protein